MFNKTYMSVNEHNNRSNFISNLILDTVAEWDMHMHRFIVVNFYSSIL